MNIIVVSCDIIYAYLQHIYERVELLDHKINLNSPLEDIAKQFSETVLLIYSIVSSA